MCTLVGQQLGRFSGVTGTCLGRSFSQSKAALRFAGTFGPKSTLALFLRNQLFKLMAIRWIADLAVGRDLADNITLPPY